MSGSMIGDGPERKKPPERRRLGTFGVLEAYGVAALSQTLVWG